MADDRTEALDGDQLANLARYFEEEVMSSKNTKHPELGFRALLTGDGARRVELTRA
jgi:hypothetical protein